MSGCQCGGTPELIWFYISGTANRQHCFVKCVACGKRTKETFRSEEKAVKAWNEGDVLPFPMEHDVEGYGYLMRHKPDGHRLLFLTDSFYCKYRFNNLNTIMIECNYIEETLDRHIANGLVPEEMKPRLLRSHFSLENVLNFLRATDLSECTAIVLLHLSAGNADAEKMKQAVYDLTGMMPVIADSGIEMEMNVFPY